MASFGRKLPTIHIPTATTFNNAMDAWKAAIEDRQIVAVPPLTVRYNGAVASIMDSRMPMMRVSLDSSGPSVGEYSATQVMETAGGGYSAYTSGQGWTGKAWEYNLNGAIVLTSPFYVEVEYFPIANEWRFQAGVCCSGCP